MLELKDMPLIPGQNQADRAVKEVKDVDLKSVGVRNGAFSLHTGDEITFEEKPLLVEQALPGSESKAYWIGCKRNGKPSWIGLGFLTRRDFNNKPLSRVQELMNAQPNFAEMYENVLKGHTIKGGQSKEYQLADFADGKRLDTPRTVTLVEAIYE